MEDFKKLRSTLKNALEEQKVAEKSLFQNQEQLKKLEREKKRLLQRTDIKDGSREAIITINEKVSLLKDQIEQGKYKKTIDRDNLKNVEEAIIRYTDPRENLSLLDDRNPIILFPLRIEIRFKQVELSGSVKDQLWVRVYPDDIAIDTFEEVLSENEVKSARTYWHQIWQAGGREGLERSAWKALASDYGSGRARYITEQYIPLNLPDKPTDADENNFHLTISTGSDIDSPEAAAIGNYWKEMWLAGSGIELQNEAMEKLKIRLSGDEEQKNKRFEEILKNYKPRNFDDRTNQNNAGLIISVHFIRFPGEDQFQTKQDSWAKAPETYVLPERLVITGYNLDGENKLQKTFQEIGRPIPARLMTGFDPNLEDIEQMQQSEIELKINSELKWIFDFEEAVAKGMGFKIDLSTAQAGKGFDRIVVLGVRITASEESSKKTLETLFEHHDKSLTGLSILPQGTPTNNTKNEDAGYSASENTDISFDHLKDSNQPVLTNDWMLKKDGQLLAESLGLDPVLFEKTQGSSQTDQLEAKAMNTVLFPATIGYMMESLMLEVFTDQTVKDTRFFFDNYVNARGSIPSIRVGNQPYGIMPTTNFQAMNWFDPKTMVQYERLSIPWTGSMTGYLTKLLGVLKRIDKDWTPLLKNVAYLGKKENLPDEPGQLIMDILGLAPNSLEYYQRYAQGEETLKNIGKLLKGADLELFVINYIKALNLLNQLGSEGNTPPEILKKIFMGHQNKLTRYLIDDVPLSEIKQIRSYTPDDKNYIEWLINASETSHDTLRSKKGFNDGKIPSALLFDMIHHALDLEYIDLSLQLIKPANGRPFKKDPPFIHIKQSESETESRWKYLYQTVPAITGSDQMLIGEYIPTLFSTSLSDSYFRKQLDALKKLANIPTARLERLLVEHIDLCTYRLDAWKQAFMTLQLAMMRNHKDLLAPYFSNNAAGEDIPEDTTYIGAYGWLENVRSEKKILKPVSLEDSDLNNQFNQDGQLMSDDQNEGYIAAPSLNHAVTAAILRNVYLSEDNPETFEINLSSERVRKALSIIEGIRAGQSLAALLGYQFERGLHDQNTTLTGIDFYIYQLRREFPLNANKMKSTQTDKSVPIEAIEASNVLDGLALVSHIKKTGQATYPFGKSSLPDTASSPSAALKNAINKQVNNIINLNDAIADIAIAEGVHQAVLGNYDKSAAVMDTYSKGNFPPIPEVIQTPRSGVNITQRFGLHFKAGISGTTSPNPMSATPRSKAEPAINNWLSAILPDCEEVTVVVSINHYNGTTQEYVVSQRDLNLQPIDLLYVMNTDDIQSMTELDDKIEYFILKKHALRPDTEIGIHHTKRIDGKINFFQLNALLNSLRTLLMESRPLEPTDVMPADEGDETANISIFLEDSRVENALDELEGLFTDLTTFLSEVGGYTSDIDNKKDDLLRDFDQILDKFSSVLYHLSDFGFPQTGLGFIYEKKQSLFRTLMLKIRSVKESWDNQLNDFGEIMNDYNTTPDEEKMIFLYNAEKKILAIPVDPRSEDPEVLKVLLDQKAGDLVAELGKINLITDTDQNSVSGLLSLIIPESDEILRHYSGEFDIQSQKDEMIQFIYSIQAKAESLKNQLRSRIDNTRSLLNDANALGQGKEKAELIQNAAKQVFGDNFRLIPEFEMPTSAAAMWSNSLGDTDKLLSHLKNDLHRDFPVDEWVYSLARVREKVQHWENAVSLAEAFGKEVPDLKPVQLPYLPEDYFWLASDYPEDSKIEQDTLLYTASYPTGFDANNRICGLLLDEWTELIPSKEEDIGVAFHYDKPDSEPPQVILMALPAQFKRAWNWEDLLDTINDTLEQAKKRAIEPDQIDKTHYARFLPATVSAVNVFQTSPSLNFFPFIDLFLQLNQEKND